MGINDIGKRIKDLRTNLNLTQKEFAEKLDITAAALSSYEKGTTNPSISVLISIAEKYNVTTDWLLGMPEKESTTEIITYTDILTCMLPLLISPNITTMLNIQKYNEKASIIFEHSKITIEMLEKVKNILELYYAKTIDKEILDAVIEKMKNDYDYKINDDLPF